MQLSESQPYIICKNKQSIVQRTATLNFQINLLMQAQAQIPEKFKQLGLGKQYNFISEISQGPNHIFQYNVSCRKSGKRYLAKCQTSKISCHLQHSLAKQSFCIRNLNNDQNFIGIGIPKMHVFSSQTCNGRTKYYLTLEPLGKDLNILFLQNGGKFSLKTTLMFAEQALRIIQHAHFKQTIIRYFRPQSFKVGIGTNQSKIYLTQFSRAKAYITKQLQHIPFTETFNLTPYDDFVSFNYLRNHQLSRRDDIQIFAELLVYFSKGELPWRKIAQDIGEQVECAFYRRRLARQITDIEQICAGCPQQFGQIYRYARSLKFEEKPNYKYIRRLLKQLFVRQGYQFDYKYDWSAKGNQKVKI